MAFASVVRIQTRAAFRNISQIMRLIAVPLQFWNFLVSRLRLGGANS